MPCHFQGLAIALMAGEVASLALSRMTVPIVYFIVNRRRSVHVIDPNTGVPGFEYSTTRFGGRFTSLEFCTFRPGLSPIPQRVEGVFGCVHSERGH
jgi:hypothetical protein